MTTRSSSRHVDESCDLIGISSTCPNADARSFVTAAALASVTCPAQFPKAGTWGQFRQEEEGLRPVDNTGTFGRKRVRPSGGHYRDFLKKKVSVGWTIVGLLEFQEEDGLHPVDNSGTLRNYGRLRVCPVDNAGRFWKERKKESSSRTSVLGHRRRLCLLPQILSFPAGASHLPFAEAHELRIFCAQFPERKYRSFPSSSSFFM